MNKDSSSLQLNSSLCKFLRSAFFDQLLRVNSAQVTFGKHLEVDVARFPAQFARGLLELHLDYAFGRVDERAATSKQIDLGRKFGIDLSQVSLPIASLTIATIMTVQDVSTIEREQLSPGTKVKKTSGKIEETYTISSIREDGIVFFKGGNGKCACARNLRRVS